MGWTMTPLPVVTPDRLADQLEELDITNSEAAYYAGVSISTVYRWLNGETPIPTSVIRMFDLLLTAQAGARMIKVCWGLPPGSEEGETNDVDVG